MFDKEFGVKIIVVSGDKSFVASTTKRLQDIGITDTTGLCPQLPGQALAFEGGDEDPRKINEHDYHCFIAEANLVFLDHNLCAAVDGGQWKTYWETRGISFMGKDLVGISDQPQPYVPHRLIVSRGSLSEAVEEKVFALSGC
jgi:hypothetical protein